MFCVGMGMGARGQYETVTGILESFGIVVIGSLGVVMLRSTLQEFFTMFPTILKVFRHKVDKPTDLIDQISRVCNHCQKRWNDCS